MVSANANKHTIKSTMQWGDRDDVSCIAHRVCPACLLLLSLVVSLLCVLFVRRGREEVVDRGEEVQPRAAQGIRVSGAQGKKRQMGQSRRSNDHRESDAAGREESQSRRSRGAPVLTFSCLFSFLAFFAVLLCIVFLSLRTPPTTLAGTVRTRIVAVRNSTSPHPAPPRRRTCIAAASGWHRSCTPPRRSRSSGRS